MTEIKIAVSHGTLREGREIGRRGNIPLIRFSERSASERGRKASRARSEIPCPPSIRSCLLMFDKGGYLSWESKFAYCFKLNSGSASPY